MRRPFLLPCLAIVLFGIIATAANVLFLEETLPRLRAAKMAARTSGKLPGASAEQLPLWRRLVSSPSSTVQLLRGYSRVSSQDAEGQIGRTSQDKGQ